MAVDTRTLAPDPGTSASFRAWGSGIAAALQACGLTQTGDTGQINWSTVTSPNSQAVNNFLSNGYEVYAFSDALQATAPCYIRIDYGSWKSSGSPTYTCGLAVTVGTSTNGAGTITGNSSGTFQLLEQFSINPCSNYTSGSSNRISQLFNIYGVSLSGVSSSASSCYWTVERSKDSTGNDTGDFIYFAIHTSTYGPSANGTEVVLLPVSGSPITSISGSAFPAFLPGLWLQSVFGNNVYVFAHYPTDITIHNPIMNQLTYFTTDFVAGTAVAVTIYGATHTYMPLGQAAVKSGNCLVGQNGSTSLMMLWE